MFAATAPQCRRPIREVPLSEPTPSQPDRDADDAGPAPSSEDGRRDPQPAEVVTIPGYEPL